MGITAKMVADLRAATNAGMMDCKKALTESDGDFDKAVEYLRTKGIAKAAKKEGRATANGLVESYIHQGGQVGVLLEINCETDFVARTDEFKQFCHDVAMHIAAASPQALDRESVDASLVQKEAEIYKAQMKEEGKPDNIIDKIVAGKVDKFYSEVCLLEQSYVKDPDMTIQEFLQSKIGSLGENMAIKRFVRFQIGG
ncbi:MAG TPA: translation elongation factor Ts [Candidatus Krumholzibacteria bacterium]|nr:translation elongation factor Ts [Candidatus Krumholzibacteria bacterium]HRX50192.1 translation elongation factor Ts [Candidatus Krumholzibacteria bacterium]